MAHIWYKLDIKSYSNKPIKQGNLLKREADDFLCKEWSHVSDSHIPSYTDFVSLYS